MQLKYITLTNRNHLLHGMIVRCVQEFIDFLTFNFIKPIRPWSLVVTFFDWCIRHLKQYAAISNNVIINAKFPKALVPTESCPGCIQKFLIVCIWNAILPKITFKCFYFDHNFTSFYDHRFICLYYYINNINHFDMNIISRIIEYDKKIAG